MLKLHNSAKVALLAFAALSPTKSSHVTPTILPFSSEAGSGFIDSAGTLVLGAQFRNCTNSLILADGEDGYLNAEGRLSARPDPPGSSARVVPFNEPLPAGSPPETRSKWGFADRSGRTVLEPQFDEIQGFSEGVWRVVKDRLWGFVDADGRILVAPQFKFAYSFSQGLSCISFDGSKWVYVDRTGQVVSDPRYDYNWLGFSEGLAPARSGGKWGFVDSSWRFVILPQFDWVASFSEGLAWVSLRDRVGAGAIDQRGKLVIEPRVWTVENFSGGLARVRPSGSDLYGYIDRDGRLVIPPRFVDARGFHGGVAWVTESPTVRLVAGPCWVGMDVINRFGEYVWRAKPGAR